MSALWSTNRDTAIDPRSRSPQELRVDGVLIGGIHRVGGGWRAVRYCWPVGRPRISRHADEEGAKRAAETGT